MREVATKLHLDALRGGFAPVARAIETTGMPATLVSAKGRALAQVCRIRDDEIPPEAFEISLKCMTERRAHVAHYAAAGLKMIMRKGEQLYLIYPPNERDPLLPELDQGPKPQRNLVAESKIAAHRTLEQSLATLAARVDALESRKRVRKK